MIRRKYLVLLSVQGLVVALDQLAKFLALISLKPGEVSPVLSHYMNLTLVFNRGAAFGVFSDGSHPARDLVFLAVPALTLAAILWVFSRLQEGQKISIYGLSLIVGGAIGNIVDRLRLGHVVDFLDFHWRGLAHFPAFNLADVSITVGAGLLIVSMFVEKDA
ncbi:MAG: signal peptidase II [Bdellovibrionales bacterium]|nr:signal peptidase II [Bdellovibrionales bacterium]